MLNQVLVNVGATDIRVAMLEDSNLVELFVEHFNKKSILGNIYKGKVEAIVPGLKAVFINVGMEKNAFLHFSDVLHEYELPSSGRPERLRGSPMKKESTPSWKQDDDYIDPQAIGEEANDPELTDAELAMPRGRRPLKVGDSMLVQVIKEPLSEKGPRVTSYLSIPGRFLVMMPFSENHGGVSRKISDMEERRRLKDILKGLSSDLGAFIIRTAGLREGEEGIREDCEALQRNWRTMLKKNLKVTAPALIHDDSDIITRLVRDALRDDIDEVLVDSRKEIKALIAACELMAPKMVNRIHFFESPKNIFEVFEVEKQFQKALRRKVWLKSGGAIVIDETEALTAIDVNSGKYVGAEDQDSVILKTNLEACQGIARQLRLRDLGGLIVIDFIDMTNKDHQQQVLKELRSHLRLDTAKYSLTGFSEFGLVEMTRKRVRKSLANSINRPCPYCEGTGNILGEAQTWKIIKSGIVEELAHSGQIDSLDVLIHSHMRTYLEKEVLADIKMLASRHKVKLNFVARPDFHHEQFQLVKHDKSTLSVAPAAAAHPAVAVNPVTTRPVEQPDLPMMEAAHEPEPTPEPEAAPEPEVKSPRRRRKVSQKIVESGA